MLNRRIFCVLSILFLSLCACATSPLGRSQLILVPESQVNQMGVQSFDELKKKQKVESDPATNAYVQCIVKPLLEASKGQTPISEWEVVVFQEPSANAFALPGGKIGVYTGLLKVAQNDAQLAAVVGHEIGHVIAHHGAERISQQAGTQLGLAALGKVAGGESPKGRVLMGLLGVGMQVGVLLPFSRIQESEADLIGLDIMARAGFDPHQSTELWRNMIAASGGKAPPQWLSTHPASESRISNLTSHMEEANEKYKKAVESGLKHSCVR